MPMEALQEFGIKVFICVLMKFWGSTDDFVEMQFNATTDDVHALHKFLLIIRQILSL